MRVPMESRGYVCEHCGATEQWSCRCWETDAAKYHHQRTAATPPTAARQREAIRWGCAEHRTPAGQPCQHCADQGELFPRADSGASTHRRRNR